MQSIKLSSSLLACVVLILPLFFEGAAHAQMKDDATILLLNTTYATSKSDLSKQTVEGWGLSGAIEKISWDKDYAFGFALGWVNYSDDYTDESDRRISNINTYPFYVYGKYFFGSPKIKGYIGAGLGAYVSNIKTCGEVFCSEVANGGLAVAVPLGGYVYVSESVLFNLNYVFNWLNNSPLENGIAHVFNFGIGFQFD